MLLGIGGPSTSIAVEELAELGVRTFLRVGMTGGIEPHLQPGDVIVTTGAVRLDGASLHFATMEFPAVADFACTTALVEAATSLGIEPYVGITVSSDTFYPGQERYDTYSGRVTRRFQGSLEEWESMGVPQLRDGVGDAVHDVREFRSARRLRRRCAREPDPAGDTRRGDGETHRIDHRVGRRRSRSPTGLLKPASGDQVRVA